MSYNALEILRLSVANLKKTLNTLRKKEVTYDFIFTSLMFLKNTAICSMKYNSLGNKDALNLTEF